MPERWYEFEQVETLPRPFWCKGTSAADAKRRAEYSGVEGVPDYAGTPSNIRIIGRGRLVRDPDDIATIEARANQILAMLDPKPAAVAFGVGDRVTHRDFSRSDGSTLPMAGTLVGVEVRYVVQWDDAEPQPVSDWTPTYSYPAAFLAALPR